jgi:hypothetical protein
MTIARRLQFGLLIGAVLAGLGAVGAFANSGQRSANRSRIYDRTTETKINGVIQEVKEVPGPGKTTGTHLTVKADGQVYDVHVGPTWYLTREEYTFAKGDTVEVIGSKVKYQGANAIIARQIKKEGKTWTLRNEQGVPLWSRPRSR